MSDSIRTCCFTGHRAAKLPWGFNEDDERCAELKNIIAQKIKDLYSQGCSRFICGMANGCDMYFGESVAELKTIHPDVWLEAAVPCANHSETWRGTLKDRYNAILAAADKVTVISPVYTRSCMMQRNRYMLDNSDILLACYDGESKGGTLNTILLAHRDCKEIILIDI